MTAQELNNKIEAFLAEDSALIKDFCAESAEEPNAFYNLVLNRLGSEGMNPSLGGACQYLYLAQRLHAAPERNDQEILLGDYLHARFFQYLDALGSPELTEVFMQYMLNHNLSRISDAELNFTREEFRIFVESICTRQQNRK